MADFKSKNLGMEALKGKDPDELEYDFCSLEDEGEDEDMYPKKDEDMYPKKDEDKGEDEDRYPKEVEDMYPKEDDDEDDLAWDVDESFYEFPLSRSKSRCKMPEDLAKRPELINMKKKVQLEDVLREHALHFLPAKSLCRFKNVSRGWDLWISNPFFAHRQTTCFKNMSGLFCQVPGFDPSFISFDQGAYGVPDPSLRFLPEHVSIRSSCNGLLCCQSVEDNVYYICNPVTKEWKRLPKPTLYHGAEAAIVLVFEPQMLRFNEAYELVCAVTFPNHPVVYFEIYSSRSSSWRVSKTVCCEFDNLKFHNGGYYMKGVVYWEASSSVILAFDLKDEEYGILPLPLTAEEYGALTMLHGELCYILARHQDGDCIIYIHGNMDMSLKSEIKLTGDDVGSIYGVCRALASTNDNMLILALGSKVIAYHVKEQKVDLISSWEGGSFTRYLPYVNSLGSVRHPLVRDIL